MLPTIKVVSSRYHECRNRAAHYSQNSKLPDIVKANEIPMTANRPSYAGAPRPAALFEEVAA